MLRRDTVESNLSPSYFTFSVGNLCSFTGETKNLENFLVEKTKTVAVRAGISQHFNSPFGPKLKQNTSERKNYFFFYFWFFVDRQFNGVTSACSASYTSCTVGS